MNLRQVLVGVGVLAVISGGIVLILLLRLRSAPDPFAVTDRAIAEIRSPDGRYVALVFERSCWTDASFNVALRNARGRIGQGAHDGVVYTDKYHGGPDNPPTVSWLDATHLLIEYPADADVREKLTRWGDVDIIYRP